MDVPAPSPPFEDPCVVHDPMTFRGGGEQYASELAAALDAPLYTQRHEISLEADVDVREFGDVGLRDEFLLRMPFRGLVVAIAYENFAVPDRHDVVITSGSAAKATIHRPFQHRIHLLHTPPRWLFDRGPVQYDDEGWVMRWLSRAYQSYMRVHDQSTVPRVDEFVVNSEVIARRLQTYNRREASAVIYPPVATDSYYHEEGAGFLLALGRLEPHKRVGEVVEALSGTDYRLKVVGTGSLEDDLRDRAGENVEFLGFVDEERKRELLATCDAVVFNSEREDFGIVPIEAFASGKPVVGVSEGFTKYQVTEGENGVLYDRGAANLRAAVAAAYETDWDAARIQASADQYDVDAFEARWRQLLQEGAST